MTKPTFELKIGIGNKDHKLVIAPHQPYSEEELVSEITPIFNRLNPMLDEGTGQLHSGLRASQCLESEPKWIFTKPDAEGIRHRMGLRVPPKLFNKLLTELIDNGYRVIPVASDSSPFKH